MNRSHAALLSLAAVLVLTWSACTPSKEDPPPKPKVSANVAALPVLGPAPAWRLKDLSGTEISSAQFKGKVVVVDFWATWCGPCVKEIPGYTELMRKYEKDGLTVVGVSLDQAGPEAVKAFATRYRVNYPVVMGDENVVGAFGGVEAIPTTFLIDRSGKIRDRKVGAESVDAYEQKVVALLN